MRPVLLIFFVLCSAFIASAGANPGQDAGSRQAALIEIDGPIGPASSLYFGQASDKAVAMGAQLIILRIDTPGGLDQAMRDMIKKILALPIPVVAYVSPPGARAASAGTYLLYASHVAAMAPATNLGAATPVPVMGSGPATPAPAEEPAGKQPAKADGEDAMRKKMVNDAVAYIRGLAERRGRNADWAERAVRDGASLPADEALKLGVIDLVAEDLPQLMAQLHGRKVQMADGTSRSLDTERLTLVTLAPDWRQRLLAVLTNPAIAYILLLIGVYGLLLEGYNPGGILPGVVGGICLLLALYAFQILPINYVGLALIGLGIALIVAETMVPSLGVLGIGGVVAFVAGSIMLLDTGIPGYDVPLGIIAAVATAAGLLVLVTLTLLLRARRKPITSGHEAMLGCEAVVLEDFTEEGWVLVQGETWRARTARPVSKGERLRVRTLQGLVLTLE